MTFMRCFKSYTFTSILITKKFMITHTKNTIPVCDTFRFFMCMNVSVEMVQRLRNKFIGEVNVS